MANPSEADEVPKVGCRKEGRPGPSGGAGLRRDLAASPVRVGRAKVRWIAWVGTILAGLSVVAIVW